jgi:cell division protein FtsX
VIYLFNRTVSSIAQEYQSDFILHFDVFKTLLSILILSAALGWFAAYNAVTTQSKFK